MLLPGASAQRRDGAKQQQCRAWPGQSTEKKMAPIHAAGARLVWCLLCLCLFAGGCAQVPHVNDPGRSKIDTVVIERNVPKPEQLYYLGPGSMGWMMFGVVGVAVGQATGAVAATTSEPAALLLDHIKKNGIEMDRIAYEEVDAEMRHWGRLTVLDAPPAAPVPNVGTLKIAVLRYGFSIPNGFSSRLVPLVILKFELVDAAGKVVWSSNDRTHPLGNPVEPLTVEEMRDNPKSIEIAWRGASRYISKRLLEEYAGER
jgi:hypothetical protein